MPASSQGTRSAIPSRLLEPPHAHVQSPRVAATEGGRNHKKPQKVDKEKGVKDVEQEGQLR